jgi:hypothetical protein
MAEPHGNRTAKLVEQTLNEIKEFTPEKAYLHIFTPFLIQNADWV